MKYAIEERGSLWLAHLFDDDGSRHVHDQQLRDARGKVFKTYRTHAPMAHLTRDAAVAWAREKGGGEAEDATLLAARPYDHRDDPAA